MRLALALAPLLAAAGVLAVPTAVGFGPGCNLRTAPVCTPEDYERAYVWQPCCKPHQEVAFKPPPGFSPYAPATSRELWLLTYTGYQGQPSATVDPKIKADLDTVCQAQGGVPGYAEKRDYESYTFEVNCIAGKGTKAEKDVTGEVAEALDLEVLRPAKSWSEKHPKSEKAGKYRKPKKQRKSPVLGGGGDDYELM